MDNIVPLLAWTIVVATVVTIVFAAVSFIMFKVRERQQAKPTQGVVNGELVGEPQFFRPYQES